MKQSEKDALHRWAVSYELAHPEAAGAMTALRLEVAAQRIKCDTRTLEDLRAVNRQADIFLGRLASLPPSPFKQKAMMANASDRCGARGGPFAFMFR